MIVLVVLSAVVLIVVVVVLIEYILSQNNGTIREEIFSSGSLLKILILGLERQIEKGNISLDSSFIERYFNISRYLPQDDLKLKRLNDIIIKDVVPYNIDSFIQNVILKQNDREKVYTFDDTLLKIFNSDLQVMLNNLEPYLSKAKYGIDFKNFTDSVINRGSQGWFSFEFETLQDSLLSGRYLIQSVLFHNAALPKPTFGLCYRFAHAVLLVPTASEL